MGLPSQGSPVQIMARALTNAALAQRVSMIQDSRRAFDKATTDALLAEAAKRLQWADIYEKHTDGLTFELPSTEAQR